MSSCTVVMYHYVRSKYTGSGIFGMTPQEFDAQVQELSSRHEMLNPNRLESTCIDDGTLPDNCCILSFDDGLTDHITGVLPILERHNVKGLFFASSLPLTDGKFVATHKAHLVGQAIGADRLRQQVLAVLPSEWSERIASELLQAEDDSANENEDTAKLYRWDESGQRVFKTWLAYKLPAALVEAALDQVFEVTFGNETEMTDTFYASRDHLRSLSAAGHLVGGHGHKHRSFGQMTASEQYEDIRRNSDVLTEVTGHRPRIFSYPFGKLTSFNASTRAALRSQGYSFAFTSIPGTARFDGDHYMLNRFDCKDVPANV